MTDKKSENIIDLFEFSRFHKTLVKYWMRGKYLSNIWQSSIEPLMIPCLFYQAVGKILVMKT